jgi:hypothetical protein
MEFLDLATDALFSIGVIDANEAPSAEQGVKALRNLNQVMASLAGDGIDLGYAPTTTITDDIAIPLEDQATIIALLAKKEASARGIPLPDEVRETADNGYARMLRNSLLLSMQPASLSTVSKGTGSDGSYNILTGA